MMKKLPGENVERLATIWSVYVDAKGQFSLLICKLSPADHLLSEMLNMRYKEYKDLSEYKSEILQGQYLTT